MCRVSDWVLKTVQRIRPINCRLSQSLSTAIESDNYQLSFFLNAQINKDAHLVELRLYCRKSAALWTALDLSVQSSLQLQIKGSLRLFSQASSLRKASCWRCPWVLQSSCMRKEWKIDLKIISGHYIHQIQKLTFKCFNYTQKYTKIGSAPELDT